MIGRQMEIPSAIASSFLLFAKEASAITDAANEAVDHIDELFQFSFGGNAAIKMKELIEKLDSLENKNDQSEITLRAELFAIEKDLPPVNVIFLYDIINKIGELSDRAEQVGHRISLIASR
jgi:predicted phosphate transport protein (TIGR00153 family)